MNALVGVWVLSFAPASESILPLLGSALLLYTAFVTGGVSYSEKTTDSWAKQVLIVSGAIKGVAAAAALLLSLHFARDQNAFAFFFQLFLVPSGVAAAIVATSELFVGGYRSLEERK